MASSPKRSGWITGSREAAGTRGEVETKVVPRVDPRPRSSGELYGATPGQPRSRMGAAQARHFHWYPYRSTDAKGSLAYKAPQGGAP
jgi:hypothetical protein